MTEPPDIIAFPDGQPYRVGAVRTKSLLTKTLAGASGGAGWDGEPGVKATWNGQDFRLQVGDFLCFLKPDPGAGRHICGGWPNEVATAFVVTRAPTGLLLEVRDAERVE